jgi:RNA polymerase sigma-70 factor (ECF subfamily)
MANSEEHTLQVQQLFVRHQGALKAFVLALWPDFAEADDVMQEVFLVITRKAAEFQPESNFLSWARTIARYEVMTARRKKARTMIKPEVLEALQAACPEDFATDRKLNALAQCMAQLAPKAREIMQLRYQQEHGPGEIAQVLARSVNSINVALAKARVALRECVDRQLNNARTP